MAAPGMSLQHPSQYLSTPAFPPERNLGPVSSHLSPPLPQMWNTNTNNLLPVSMGVSILDILCKFICILCGLYVCLLSLSMMSLGFIPIVACYRDFIAFHGWVMFISSWIFELFPCFGYYEQCYCKYAHTNFQTNMFSCLWGRYPGVTQLSHMVAWSTEISHLKGCQMACHSDGTTHIHNPPLTAVQDFLISISSSLLPPASLLSWSLGEPWSTIVLWFSFALPSLLMMLGKLLCVYWPPRQVLKNCLFCEVAQQLRVLVLFLEDPGSIHSGS